MIFNKKTDQSVVKLGTFGAPSARIESEGDLFVIGGERGYDARNVFTPLFRFAAP